MEEEYDALLRTLFVSDFRKGYVRVGPKRAVMPIYYQNFAQAIDNLQVRDSDAWVISHPKTGHRGSPLHADWRGRSSSTASADCRGPSDLQHLATMAQLTYSDLGGDLGRLMSKVFTSDFRSGYLLANGVVVPNYYRSFGDRILNLDVRNSDHWVVSFPKTGTTWTQEMVWCIGNDLNFEGAKVFLPERFPFLEHSPLFDYTDILPRLPDLQLPPFVSDSVKYVSNLPSPRFIKTHLPWELLPKQIQEGTKKPKLIYVARNAKDTCVSYYHHCKLLEGYRGDFDDFCKLFMGDSVCFTPFWSHVLSFWERRDEPNILFLKYEDMKKDLPSVITKTAEFLGKSLNEDQVAVLADHLSFQSMKKNPAVNYEAVVEINRTFNLIDAEGQFMRSGKVGEWKDKMTPELIDKFDAWTEKNLKGTGLTL